MFRHMEKTYPTLTAFIGHDIEAELASALAQMQALREAKADGTISFLGAEVGIRYTEDVGEGHFRAPIDELLRNFATFFEYGARALMDAVQQQDRVPEAILPR